MRGSPLVVVLLLVIAGCNAPADEPPSPTPLTPAPVPDTESAGLAPGVTEAGSVDPNALQDAHTARLDGGGFTLRRVRVERSMNGTLRSRTRLVAMFPGDGRYHIERTFTGPVHDRVGTGGTLLQYGDANGTVRLRRAANGSVRSRSLRSPPSGAVPRTAPLTDPFTGRTILLVLRGVEFDAPSVVGEGRYRLRGAGIADRAAVRSLLSPTLMESLRNVTATVIVTDAGLVERLRFSYTVNRWDASVRVTREIRYSDVGNTTLERPAWVTNATRTGDDV